MKSPREILLKRHRPMEGRLDEIRRKAVAASVEEISGVAVKSPDRLKAELRAGRGAETLGLLGLGVAFWNAIVRPYPKIWAGMAVAWMVTLALNLDSAHSRHPEMARSAPPKSEEWVMLREQRRLAAQILDIPESPVGSPKPRSEAKSFVVIG